ncbi:MAG TPA: hypothetical protein VMW76_06560 [Bacteroidales bacterium]|nr:hypothetical protein [Bacteroidales bacterium]
MIYLLICILSSSLIMVIFKIAGRLNLDNFNLILINYLAAAILGFLIGGIPGKDVFTSSWLPMAVIIGILFISLFFVIAASTQKAGIAVTSVASKMSVIIPILFSVIYFKEEVTSLKLAGFILAMVSVFLTIYQQGKNKQKKYRASIIMIPLVLFIGAGVIDSLIKFTQSAIIYKQNPIVFSSILFSISAVCGILFALVRGNQWHHFRNRKLIFYGIFLGIVNFGSLYGIIKALNSEVFDSSVVFGINNVGVVLLSVLLATIFYKEKLTVTKKIGIALSIITIVVLSVI